MTNTNFYKHVKKQLSKKGGYKLANAIAHGNELESIEAVVRLRSAGHGDYIFITVEGDTYKAVKCI